MLTLEVLGFPPFFIAWFPSFTIFYSKVYHLPKGTPIFKMVVDFQGWYIQSEKRLRPAEHFKHSLHSKSLWKVLTLKWPFVLVSKSSKKFEVPVPALIFFRVNLMFMSYKHVFLPAKKRGVTGHSGWGVHVWCFFWWIWGQLLRDLILDPWPCLPWNEWIWGCLPMRLHEPRSLFRAKLWEKIVIFWWGERKTKGFCESWSCDCSMLWTSKLVLSQMVV